MKALLKKILLFALALALLVPLSACKKQEENPDDGRKPSDDDPPDYVAGEGQVPGSELTWEMRTNGTLYLRGTGAMPDFDFKSVEDSDIPWTAYLQGNIDTTLMIKKVVIEEGVTSIGENAFYGCRRLTDVTLPASLTGIGYNSFVNCRQLTKVGGGIGVKVIAENAFSGCTVLATFSVSTALAEVRTGAFSGCRTLTLLVTGTEEEWKGALDKMIIGEGNDAFRNATAKYYAVK